MKPKFVVFTEHSDQRLSDLLAKVGQVPPKVRGKGYEVIRPEDAENMSLEALNASRRPRSAQEGPSVDHLLSLVGEG
jgi:hypothetical protein